MLTNDPVIEVTSLGKDFPGRKVLDGLTFSVDKREVFGFIGPNGAGKTTTMLSPEVAIWSPYLLFLAAGVWGLRRTA